MIGPAVPFEAGIPLRMMLIRLSGFASVIAVDSESLMAPNGRERSLA